MQPPKLLSKRFKGNNYKFKDQCMTLSTLNIHGLLHLPQFPHSWQSHVASTTTGVRAEAYVSFLDLHMSKLVCNPQLACSHSSSPLFWLLLPYFSSAGILVASAMTAKQTARMVEWLHGGQLSSRAGPCVRFWRNRNKPPGCSDWGVRRNTLSQWNLVLSNILLWFPNQNSPAQRGSIQWLHPGRILP